VAIPFIDELRAWHARYEAQGGRRSVRIEWHEGSDDSPKRAAWIDVDAPSALGRLTLWESGECDTEAIGTPTMGEPHAILVRSRRLPDPSRVAAVADDLVDHLADYSAT
jgi:hypothetical protein